MDSRRVFVTGGTGYIGQRLIRVLCARGHRVDGVVRPGSEKKLPSGCTPVIGNVLDGASYASHVSPEHTFVQLVGVAHPSPAKARQFVEIDERSAMEAIRVAREAGVRHFVYVSVAHPAPAMHAYVAVRSRCEEKIWAAGLSTTILRPWYVLGPGHNWPRLLIPMYWLAERIPVTREGARRLGLVTIGQMVAALVRAVENPMAGMEILDVPRIREA
ncbi:MAG TPA: NAD(P)H-binding protein [Bryobacteraceae bacterium]|nr:NAD(P)H-binding protein [Bryobacteraceae bacterium]